MCEGMVCEGIAWMLCFWIVVWSVWVPYSLCSTQLCSHNNTTYHTHTMTYQCAPSTPSTPTYNKHTPPGGFYINSDSIPVWLAWIKYLSFVYYAFAGLMISQLQGECCFDCENVCNVYNPSNGGECQSWIPAPGCLHTGDQVLRRYGYGGWYVVCGESVLCGGGSVFYGCGEC